MKGKREKTGSTELQKKRKNERPGKKKKKGEREKKWGLSRQKKKKE
jgi:hypothetical protein